MKLQKILILLIGTTILLSCQSETKTESTPTSSSATPSAVTLEIQGAGN